MKTKNQTFNNLSSIFQEIGTNLSNFYSSRPKQPSNTNRKCTCLTEEAENIDELQFYKNQANLIAQTAVILSHHERSQEEHIFSQVLMMSVDHIKKIMELLGRKILCQCKQTALKEIPETKKKVQFLREENQKFFRLYEQKVKENQGLAAKVKEIERQLDKLKQLHEEEMDLRPVTARINDKDSDPLKIDNSVYISSSGYNNNDFSLTCSQISKCSGTARLRQNINPTPQKKTLPTTNCAENDRKSRIFTNKQKIFQSHLC